MSKVVSLDGGALPEPGEPSEGCIELLERLLEDAKNGQIHAVGVVTTYHVGGVRWALVGSAMGFDLIGACEMIKRAIQARIS